VRRAISLARLAMAIVAVVAGVELFTTVAASAATPNAPTGAMATTPTSPVPLGDVVVSWDAPSPVSGVTIVGYTVTTSPGTQSCAVPATSLSCVIPGIPGGTAVVFSVSAFSAGGTGSSDTFDYTTPAKATTTVSLSGFPVAPQNLNTPITFVAALPTAATGKVNFELAGTSLPGCGAQVVTSGYANCTTTSLVAGTNSVTAVYSGDANFSAQTSSPTSYQISSSTLIQQTSPLVITTTFGPGNVALTLTTTGGSGSGAVTYSVANGSATGCAISGAALTMTTAGTCLVTAQKASDGTYLPESSNVTTIIFFASYAAIYGVISEWPGAYDCPNGGTLSGMTCGSQTESATVTGWYCPSGGTLSGSTCTYVYTGTFENYYCEDGGSLYGTQCRIAEGNTKSTCTYTWNPAGGGPSDCYYGYGAARNYSCPSGGSTGGSGSTCTFIYTGTPDAWSCPSGWTLSEPNCTYPSYTASVEFYDYSYGYTCPDYGTDSGYTCTISGGDGPNVRDQRSTSTSRVRLRGQH
jgi:hypothetical protein